MAEAVVVGQILHGALMQESCGVDLDGAKPICTYQKGCSTMNFAANFLNVPVNVYSHAIFAISERGFRMLEEASFSIEANGIKSI